MNPESPAKDIIANQLSPEDRATLVRTANVGQRLNKRNESPFLTIGIGREKGYGVTVYTHTEVSRTQLIAMLNGFVSLLEKDAVSIVTI